MTTGRRNTLGQELPPATFDDRSYDERQIGRRLPPLETPNTVHGRLLEAVHIAGYTFERACGELEWLLDDDRWKTIGGGFEHIDDFIETIDVSHFRQALTQRKQINKRLEALGVGQRAASRMLGVSEQTVARDRGKSRGAPSGATTTVLDANTPETALSAGPTAPHGAAWFQSDADPSKEAKRIARNDARELEREQIRSARPSPPLPPGQFPLLLADPPWRYEHVKTESRAIENQYPTMSLDELCAFRPPAAADAVLFLWATSPKVAEAMKVIEAWGFTYRTLAVWDKEVIGMGYYFRQQCELLLVATCGSHPVKPEFRPPSLFRAKRSEHSEKPTLVYGYLEAMYPDYIERDRVELFARVARDGWTAWGNEPIEAGA